MSMVDMVCVVWRRFGVHGSADPVWHIGVLVAVGVKLKFTFCLCSMVIPRYEMSSFYRIFHSYASVIDHPVIISQT